MFKKLSHSSYISLTHRQVKSINDSEVQSLANFPWKSATAIESVMVFPIAFWE